MDIRLVGGSVIVESHGVVRIDGLCMVGHMTCFGPKRREMKFRHIVSIIEYVKRKDEKPTKQLTKQPNKQTNEQTNRQMNK